MKKHLLKKALCVLLVCALAAASLLPVCAGTPAEDAHLHFNADGKFRILNFSDFQDGDTLDSRTQAFIRQSVYAAQPDLIVLTGDNIYGKDVSSASETRTAIASFMDIFESLGVPVAVVFGNHDDEGKALSKEEQMKIYNSYSVSVSYDEGSSMDGCGTYNVPIYGSTESDKVKFNLWMFDTGSATSGLNYDHMRDNQLSWYVSKSNELKAQNGGVPVPSMAFQHIIVKEIYDALQVVSSNTSDAVSYNGNYYVLPDTAAPGSIMREHPCPSDGGDEFSVVKQQGDVIAIVCGHDHRNMFIVPHQGIDLINTPATGFYETKVLGLVVYHGDDDTRGARIIDIDEQTCTYTTQMLILRDLAMPEYSVRTDAQKYVKDIAFCVAPSAQYGGLENAKNAAFNRVYSAVDAANGNGVALKEDLNGGSTSESSSGNHYVICMGYTLTENPNEAVRALGLLYSTSSSVSPYQYDGQTAAEKLWNLCNYNAHAVNGTDGAVNLNAGTNGNPMYLYASYRASDGDPLTEIIVTNTGSKKISMSNYSGYSLIYGMIGSNTGSSYADLNKSASGDYVYALSRSVLNGTSRLLLDSEPLRAACFEARKLLKNPAAMYTSQSRAALADAVQQTQNGILHDLEDDRETTTYTQSDLNQQQAYVTACIQNLEPASFTVTFDAAGGDCGEQIRSIRYGDAIGTLPAATWNRYSFDGWYTADGTRMLAGTKYTALTDQTWYAQWSVDESWLAGDADQNGNTDLRDVTTLLRFLAGGWDASVDFDHADVNADGNLDLRDVILLRRYLAGGWDVKLI